MNKESWSTLITRFKQYELQSPSDPDMIVLAFSELNLPMNDELGELYETSNGIFDNFGQWFVIWPLANLVIRTKEAWGRDAYRGYVGFGDDGTGNAFLVRCDGSSGVYYWSEIDFEPRYLETSLRAFWTGWSSSKLKV